MIIRPFFFLIIKPNMPSILPPIDCSYDTTFEKFKTIVEKYKQVIENNDTARCIIGFTAASVIRNEDDTDLDSFENWLQSIEQQHKAEQHGKYLDTNVSKILHVVETASMGYYEEEEVTSDDEHYYENNNVDEKDSAHGLDRYTSRNPFASQESYPTNTYVPDRTFVNRTFDNGLGNLFLPLNRHHTSIQFNNNSCYNA